MAKNKTPQPPRPLLDALLRPRTVQVVGRRSPADQIRVGKKIARRDGPVDLVLIASSRNISAPVNRAALQAQAVVVLPGGELARADHERHRAAVLGPDGGVWSPIVGAGIAAPAFHTLERRPTLVVTQNRAAAHQILRAAASRGLRLLGAVCTGGGHSPTSWTDLVTAAAAQDPAPVVLVQLQQPVPLSALTEVARLNQDMVLVLPRSRPLAGEAFRGTPVDQAVVARALGLTVVHAIPEAVEASFLLGRGVRRHGAVVRAVAASAEEAVLLEDALGRCGVCARLVSHTPASTKRQKGSPPAADRVDCNLLGGEPPAREAPAALSLALDGAVVPGPGRAVEATLRALASLQAPGQWRPDQTLRRPRVGRAEAQRLLDGWRASLNELQAKELLRCYGLNGPAEELVTSASGVSRMAREIGFPVAVKAVGPQLQGRMPRGAVALGVSNESSVRQAFREVVNACGALHPAPLLEGVLVSAMLDLPAFLQIDLVWSSPSPPLLLARACVAHLHAPTRALVCPASMQGCRDLAAALLVQAQLSAKPAPVNHLARFLSHLSWMGADLDGRMRWLRLDTVSPPDARTPPLVIDGYGEQTESLRAPEY